MAFPYEGGDGAFEMRRSLCRNLFESLRRNALRRAFAAGDERFKRETA